MEIDTKAVDLALTTTRAVRRRLDLERPVDNQIILDCIDIAEQAPTGGNQSSRRWIVVRDPETKQELARLYRDVVGDRTTHHRQPPPRPPDQYATSSRGHQGPCRGLGRRLRTTIDQSGVAPEISATDANRDQSSRDSVSGRARLSIPARANPAESR